MAAQLRPAIFLDRDGTINVEKDYLYRVDEFEFIPGVPEAIARLNGAGYLVVVVTNQSGVARGYYTLADVERLHRHLNDLLAPCGASVDAFYVCPHHPTAGEGDFRCDCDCRKGEPGLLLQAAAEHGIDLARSFMIGDKRADLEAGGRAGCRALLVRTGYGARTELAGVGKTPVFDDLSNAVDYILAGAEASRPTRF